MAESNVSQKCTNFDRIQALKFNFGFDLGETWHENLWSFLMNTNQFFTCLKKIWFHFITKQKQCWAFRNSVETNLAFTGYFLEI